MRRTFGCIYIAPKPFIYRASRCGPSHGRFFDRQKATITFDIRENALRVKGSITQRFNRSRYKKRDYFNQNEVEIEILRNRSRGRDKSSHHRRSRYRLSFFILKFEKTLKNVNFFIKKSFPSYILLLRNVNCIIKYTNN